METIGKENAKQDNNYSVPFIADLYGNGFIQKVKELTESYLNSRLGKESKLKSIDIERLSVYLSNYIIVSSEDEFNGEFLEQFEMSFQDGFASNVIDAYISNCIDTFSNDYNLFQNSNDEILKGKYKKYVDRIKIELENYKLPDVEKFMKKYHSDVIRKRVRRYYYQVDSLRLDKIGINLSEDDLISEGVYYVYLQIYEYYKSYGPYRKLLFKTFSKIDIDKLFDDIIDEMNPFRYIEELNRMLFTFEEYKNNKNIKAANIKKIIEFSDNEFEKYSQDKDGNSDRVRTRQEI